MQKCELSIFCLIKSGQICSFLFIQDWIYISIRDMLFAVVLTQIVRCLFFSYPLLSFLDSFPRQGVHLFHPSFNLLVITLLYALFYDLTLFLKDLQNFLRSSSNYSCKIDIFFQRVRIIDSIVIISTCLEREWDLALLVLSRGTGVDRVAGNYVREFVGLVTDWTEASLKCFMRRKIHL